MSRQIRFGMVVLVTLVSSLGWGKDHKLATDLRTDASKDLVSVIVQFNRTPGETHKNKIRSKGGTVDSDLSFVKAVAGKIPKNRLQELANDPDVAYISPDRPLHSHLNNTAGAVNANYAWQLGLDGTGVTVAVVDSGIHDFDDLKDTKGHSRILYAEDFTGTDKDDHYGHGTHVSGIIGGTGKDSSCSSCDVKFLGLAPNVRFVNLKALDNNGRGTDSTVINAINRAIQLKSTYNIRIMNLSLGRPVFESYTQDPLCQAVEAAWKAGIFVVVAAGNDGRDNSAGTNGYATITAPGNDPYVITAGAMNTNGTPTRYDDVIATYSSKGPTLIDHIVKPDLVAPGNRVSSIIAGNLSKLYPNNRTHRNLYDRNAKTTDILTSTSF